METLRKNPAIAAVAATGALALVAFVGIGLYLFVFQDEPYEFNGGFYEPGQAAGSLALTDQNDELFDEAQLQDNVSLVFFGYTHCPDYCPLTMQEMITVEDELGEQADDVNVIMVTVDPERDTPERMGEYLAAFDEDFIGLTGSEEAVTESMREWGITATQRETESDVGYLVDHPTSLWGLDPDGNLRATWPYGMEPELIAEDVAHMLDEHQE